MSEVVMLEKVILSTSWGQEEEEEEIRQAGKGHAGTGRPGQYRETCEAA